MSSSKLTKRETLISNAAYGDVAPQHSKVDFTDTLRISDWWEFKLSPVFGIVYATAFTLQTSTLSLWQLLLLVLIALAPGAAYVSLINDLTDLDDDIASGKQNRLVGKSKKYIASVIAACLLSGVAVAIYWRHKPLLLFLYVAAWVVFSVYSIPPVRLKTRGLLGLLADACGAHLLPSLLVVALVFRWLNMPINRLWFAGVAVWSMCLGLRGILWHQLTDAENDKKISLPTFVSRRTITQLRITSNYFIFPLELCGLATLLWLAQSYVAIATLGIYLILEATRKALWGTNLVIVVPHDRFRIVMLEYYELFFPLSFLLSSALNNPWDLLIVGVHLLFFHNRARQTAKDIMHIIKALS